MLLAILKAMTQGTIHSQAELARRLKVSEGLLVQMLEDLTRMGYLRQIGGGCDSRCAACPLAKTCAVGGPTKVWALTEKGRRAVEDEE